MVWFCFQLLKLFYRGDQGLSQIMCPTFSSRKIQHGIPPLPSCLKPWVQKNSPGSPVLALCHPERENKKLNLAPVKLQPLVSPKIYPELEEPPKRHCTPPAKSQHNPGSPVLALCHPEGGGKLKQAQVLLQPSVSPKIYPELEEPPKWHSTPPAYSQLVPPRTLNRVPLDIWGGTSC